MEIVEGQTNRYDIEVDLRKGRLTAYTISEAKLKLFRDGGTWAGRMDDWSYTLLTCSISFLVAWLTTDNKIAQYVLCIFTIVGFIASIVLFVLAKKKKKDLIALYEEVVSGKM